MTAEIREDMLPPNEDHVDPPAPPVEPPAPPAAKPEPPAPPKPPQDFVPHGALERERAKRAEAERLLNEANARLAELESGNAPSSEVFSDEGKAIMDTVKNLQQQIAGFQRREEMAQIIGVFPQLAEKRAEFDTFVATKPGYSLQDAAQLFIVESGIIVDEPPKPRKGVERPTGGSRLPPKTGMSADEVDDLRINHPRKFAQMIRDGKIDPDTIHS